MAELVEAILRECFCVMKLSIIIPCYNAEKLIQKCVESILVQKGFDFELILVNDGSTDKTLEILENLAQTDKE
jgi:glycosyltransferase EpsH